MGKQHGQHARHIVPEQVEEKSGSVAYPSLLLHNLGSAPVKATSVRFETDTAWQSEAPEPTSPPASTTSLRCEVDAMRKQLARLEGLLQSQMAPCPPPLPSTECTQVDGASSFGDSPTKHRPRAVSRDAGDSLIAPHQFLA